MGNMASAEAENDGGSIMPGSQSIEDFIYDAEIARQVERDKLQRIFTESQRMTAQLAEREGRCKVCTLKPPCKHHPTISVNK